MSIQKTGSRSAAGTPTVRRVMAPPPEAATEDLEFPILRQAKFRIGQVVRHRHFPFRGVVFDVDPVFGNTEEWWLSIPEHIRPLKDQPFYHLYAENAEQEYVAYVSEQNLEPDTSDEPVRHPKVAEALRDDGAGGWRMRAGQLN